MLDYRPFSLGRERLVSSSPLAELVARDDGAREGQAAIYADLERVRVIVKGAERQPRRRRSDGSVAELPVGAGLHAAEEARVVVAERKSVEVVVAAEGAAEMRADIEAGPGVDRRGIGRRLVVVVAGAEIGGGSRQGDGERGGGHGGKQHLFHFRSPRQVIPGALSAHIHAGELEGL